MFSILLRHCQSISGGMQFAVCPAVGSVAAAVRDRTFRLEHLQAL